MTRRGPLIGTFQLTTCFNHSPPCHFIQTFEIVSLEPVRSNALTNSFDTVFPNPLDRKIYDTKFPTDVRFNFSYFFFSYHSNSCFDAQKLRFSPDRSHVATFTVSYYLHSRNIKIDFQSQVNCCYRYHFRSLEFMQLPVRVKRLAF